MWLIWKTWFLDVLNRHAPVSEITIKGISLPYIRMEIRQIIRQHDYLRKMANKTGSPYLQIRNKVAHSIRKARADYYSKTIEENKRRSRENLEGFKTSTQ